MIGNVGSASGRSVRFMPSTVWATPRKARTLFFSRCARAASTGPRSRASGNNVDNTAASASMCARQRSDGPDVVDVVAVVVVGAVVSAAAAAQQPKTTMHEATKQATEQATKEEAPKEPEGRTMPASIATAVPRFTSGVGACCAAARAVVVAASSTAPSGSARVDGRRRSLAAAAPTQ